MTEKSRSLTGFFVVVEISANGIEGLLRHHVFHPACIFLGNFLRNTNLLEHVGEKHVPTPGFAGNGPSFFGQVQRLA